MSKVYMAVTADKYELPWFTADTVAEMAERLGVRPNSVHRLIHCGAVRRNGLLKGCRVIRVEVEDE